MAYFREVICAPHSLHRQQWYTMRHCLRKGRWLFKTQTIDKSGRDDQYYIREAIHLTRVLRVSGHKALF